MVGRRSEARLKRRHRKSIVMLSSCSELDIRPASDLPPSTIAHHHHHHHHHPMSSGPASVPSSCRTVASAVDAADVDVGCSSAGYGNGCCAAASSDRHPFPLPVLDCACADVRFRPPRCENAIGLAQGQEASPTIYPPDRVDFSSFKDFAATDRLLRMPDAAILLPVADSAVNYGLEDNTRTSLRTVDVCQSCCTDSQIA